MITYHTLYSGLRCVHINAPGLADICGIAVNVGSRDESAENEGLAHFVEHTLFKGTKRRRAWHIINRMEAVGGELNAYTTKENTVVYSIFPSGNGERSIDLIADLICNSQFPSVEIEKEREVVGEEISSYLDMPADAVFDDIDELVFRNNPLAHNILGNKLTLSNFDSSRCRQWVRRHYTADRMVFFYSGSETSGKVFRWAEKYFSPLSSRGSEPIVRIKPGELTCPRINKIERGGHQAHCVIAARVPGLYDDSRFALGLFANMLGGPGMNSILNVNLRERRGLVYSTEASTSLYSDCGLLSIYFGCDPDDVVKCRKIAMNSYMKLAGCDFSLMALEKAKRQYLGQMAIASENRENNALSAARSFLYRGKVFSLQETKAHIEALQKDDIGQMVEKIGEFVELTLC